MLRVLLEEGPWEGHLSRTGNSKESNAAGSPNPPPSCACPLHPGLSLSDSIWRRQVWRQGSFGSFHHMILSSTGQIMPLIPPGTDQRQLLRQQTGLDRWSKRWKRGQGHRALSSWWTQHPQGLGEYREIAGGVPNPHKIRISFQLLLDVEKELGNAFGHEP